MQNLTRAALIPAAIVAVVTLTLAVSALSGRPVGDEALVHLLILVAYAFLAFIVLRIRSVARRTVLMGLLAITTMFILYLTLGHVAFTAIPWNGDATLRSADRIIGFGHEPTVWLSEHLARSHAVVESLAFFYAAFIPYLYISIFLTLAGRPPHQQAEFITAFVVLYALSFLGYLFVPARGPVVGMASAFATPLNGGHFHELVVSSVASTGGPHGAFPSLHLGASLMLCLFDLRRGDPLRGLVYVPLVAGIALATLVLRYHYLVDLLMAVILALTSLAVARRWTSDGAIA